MFSNPNFPISKEKPAVRFIWLAMGLAMIGGMIPMIVEAINNSDPSPIPCVFAITAIGWFAYGFISHRTVGAGVLVAFCVYESFFTPTVNVWVSCIYSAIMICRFLKRVQSEWVGPSPTMEVQEEQTEHSRLVS